MTELLSFLGELVRLYEIVVIAAAVLQLLVQFNVINYSNPMVRSIYTGLYAVTEPLLKPIRRWLPKSSGLDFSPILLIIACWFIRLVLIPNVARMV